VVVQVDEVFVDVVVEDHVDAGQHLGRTPFHRHVFLSAGGEWFRRPQPGPAERPLVAADHLVGAVSARLRRHTDAWGLATQFGGRPRIGRRVFRIAGCSRVPAEQAHDPVWPRTVEHRDRRILIAARDNDDVFRMLGRVMEGNRDPAASSPGYCYRRGVDEADRDVILAAARGPQLDVESRRLGSVQQQFNGVDPRIHRHEHPEVALLQRH